MKITFYNNTSENNKVDKNLTFIIELEGTLRGSSSITSPVIDVEFENGTITTNFEIVTGDDYSEVLANGDEIALSFVENVIHCNYAYIDEFERYFFVNDIIALNNRLFRFMLSIDVLMSHKDKFRQLEGFITRNEFEYNKLIRDDLVSFYYDKQIFERMFAKGSAVDTTFVSNENVYYKNYTICVINDSSIINNTGIVENKPTWKMPNVSAFTSGIYNQNATYGTSALELSFLTKKIFNDDTLKSYIISVNAFPFAPKTKVNSEWLRLGNTTLEEESEDDEITFEGVRVYGLNFPQGSFHTIADFTYKVENPSFLDYEPYTEYEIYLPYLSYVKIPADKFVNKRIKVSYAVNYQDGSAQVFIISDYDVIYTSNCQIGVQIALNSTNALEVKNNNISNGINLGLGLMGGAIGVATCNPLAVATSVLSVSKSVASFVQNQNTNYELGSGAINSSNLGRFGYTDVYVRFTKLKPRSYDDKYFKFKGRPLNEVKYLKDVHGFTIINDIHLEYFDATTSEKTLLLDFFKNGVIL